MKIYLALQIFSIIIGSIVTQKKQDNDSIPPMDSLSFSYDVRKMTILVNDTLVHYSVVFNPETGLKKKEYIRVKGAFTPYEAIKYFGRKYKDGILIYKKESEVTNE